MDPSRVAFHPQPTGLPQPPPSQPSSSGQTSETKKRRRSSQSCDYSHERSIGCQPGKTDASKCQNCIDFAHSCTYDQPAKKGGVKSGMSSENGSSFMDRESAARPLMGMANRSGSGKGKWTSAEWRKGNVEGYEQDIGDLVDVYFEVVYPLYPLFHRPSLLRRLEAREYLTNQSFSAVIFALCALAAARARNGALYSHGWNPEYFKNPLAEVYFTAADEVMRRGVSKMMALGEGLDWMRACALLALYGIQIGEEGIAHQYLGMYHSLVSIDGLQDEKNWPKHIGIVETELRRRLFWSMYCLEVYCSAVWGRTNRCREAQAQVAYASEIEDEDFSDAGYNHPSSHMIPQQSITNPNSWLHGWNFVTELYRILEHAMDDFYQRTSSRVGPVSLGDLFGNRIPHQSHALNRVMSMYSDLPPMFKEPQDISQNGKQQSSLDKNFGFQSANITATLHHVRMILTSPAEETVDQKYAIARDLLDGLNKIPACYLRAMSSPLLLQIAAIASILSSPMKRPYSEPEYVNIRQVLLETTSLVSHLAAGFTDRLSAETRLWSQLHVLDNSWYRAAQLQGESTCAAGTPSILTFVPPPPLRLRRVADPNIDPSVQDSGVTDGGISAAGFKPNAHESVPQGMGVNGSEMDRAAAEENNQSGDPQ